LALVFRDLTPEPTFFLKGKLGPASINSSDVFSSGWRSGSVVSFADDGLLLDPGTNKNTGIVDVLMRPAEGADEARRRF